MAAEPASVEAPEDRREDGESVGVTAVSRPVLRYHGGKWRIAPWIISHFPKHQRYLEPYGGGGSVLMRKERVDCEVYNDLDGEIVNFFRVLRDPILSEQLRRAVTLTPYARAEHRLSYVQTDDPLEQARRTAFRAYSSYSGASRRMTGMRPTLGQRGNRPELDWRGWPSHIPAWCDRLSTVQIECMDAIAAIAKWDREDALIYADPPYPHSTRTMVRSQSHFHYSVELTDDDHRLLAAALSACLSTVVVSGYACPLYDEELYRGWARHTRHARANGTADRTEVLWVKPAGVIMPAPLSLVQHSFLEAANV
jgi:DNA adenine methylase